jgi:hypothetical protein
VILAAVVLCLVASMAFAQRIAPSSVRSGPSPGTASGTPSASGLTSGAATGVTSGMPSASGLTSGSGAAALPSGTPSTSGLTSGSAATAIPGNGVTTSPSVGATPDVVASPTGGSTRGVVVLQPDTPTQNPNAPLPQQDLPAAAGVTPDPAATMGATGGVVVITPGGGAGGATNGVPSAAPGGNGRQPGPVTAVQVARMFLQADADGDGLLSRAEALRLPFVTMTFEDMDTNRDGSVSRSEYEASLR